MKTHSLSLSDLQLLVAGTAGTCKFVMAGANGYSCRYPNGQWDYIVTKSPFEATKDTVVNGWISSMAGGYWSGRRP
ncbi:garvicin Q family class II bacteriocin [Streptococcus danieliae]|uniref:Garvicin Q family class II bacteriocin n=1 Tax=Streptococcus danieliae TaxID=747656 RepID=A0A7Z0M6N5_9STRE|nr:garvicin Q family class II bacteriocin [Streptococcus danieliae]MBF0699520.1 garvicin Q family class II bacteriocin [Streptococcus danieliae]MBF0844521.1 garvicin Q family class II bacteriocin [Streptococcus danieliae]MCU0081936.1 garvicin Q family class II bacteriocin [Streptococcus danieliae]NYS33000.1 garvicin Q family class II bacteriocin [Streptococcus danieliae]NYS96696.1 garvicin Q family class II bacteriocin [Streptococcus danieliae]